MSQVKLSVEPRQEGRGGLLFPSQQVAQPALMILVMLHFLSTVPQSMKESLTGQCLTVPDCQGASDYYNFQSKGLGVLYVYLLSLKTKINKKCFLFPYICLKTSFQAQLLYEVFPLM